eukprot:jgi/Mesvir1/21871/Mv04247-RA.1
MVQAPTATNELPGLLWNVFQRCWATGEPAAVWFTETLRVLNEVGATTPCEQLGELLISQLGIGQIPSPRVVEYLKHGMATRLVSSLQVFSLLPGRAIPLRRARPVLFDVFLNLVAEFVPTLAPEQGDGDGERAEVERWASMPPTLGPPGGGTYASWGGSSLPSVRRHLAAFQPSDANVALVLLRLAVAITEALVEDLSLQATRTHSMSTDDVARSEATGTRGGPGGSDRISGGVGMRSHLTPQVRGGSSHAVMPLSAREAELLRSSCVMGCAILGGMLVKPRSSALLFIARHLCPHEYVHFEELLDSFGALSSRLPVYEGASVDAVVQARQRCLLSYDMALLDHVPTKLLLDAITQKGRTPAQGPSLGPRLPALSSLLDTLLEDAVSSPLLADAPLDITLADVFESLLWLHGAPWGQLTLAVLVAALRVVYRARWLPSSARARMSLLLSAVPKALSHLALLGYYEGQEALLRPATDAHTGRGGRANRNVAHKTAQEGHPGGGGAGAGPDGVVSPKTGTGGPKRPRILHALAATMERQDASGADASGPEGDAVQVEAHEPDDLLGASTNFKKAPILIQATSAADPAGTADAGATEAPANTLVQTSRCSQEELWKKKCRAMTQAALTELSAFKSLLAPPPGDHPGLLAHFLPAAAAAMLDAAQAARDVAVIPPSGTGPRDPSGGWDGAIEERGKGGEEMQGGAGDSIVAAAAVTVTRPARATALFGGAEAPAGVDLLDALLAACSAHGLVNPTFICPARPHMLSAGELSIAVYTSGGPHKLGAEGGGGMAATSSGGGSGEGRRSSLDGPPGGSGAADGPRGREVYPGMPAASCEDLQAAFHRATSPMSSPQAVAATVRHIVGASLQSGWAGGRDVQETALHLTLELLEGAGGEEGRGWGGLPGAALLEKELVLSLALEAIADASTDVLRLFNMHGQLLRLVSALVPICDTYGARCHALASDPEEEETSRGGGDLTDAGRGSDLQRSSHIFSWAFCLLQIVVREYRQPAVSPPSRTASLHRASTKGSASARSSPFAPRAASITHPGDLHGPRTLTEALAAPWWENRQRQGEEPLDCNHPNDAADKHLGSSSGGNAKGNGTQVEGQQRGGGLPAHLFPGSLVIAGAPGWGSTRAWFAVELGELPQSTPLTALGPTLGKGGMDAFGASGGTGAWVHVMEAVLKLAFARGAFSTRHPGDATSQAAPPGVSAWQLLAAAPEVVDQGVAALCAGALSCDQLLGGLLRVCELLPAATVPVSSRLLSLSSPLHPRLHVRLTHVTAAGRSASPAAVSGSLEVTTSAATAATQAAAAGADARSPPKALMSSAGAMPSLTTAEALNPQGTVPSGVADTGNEHASVPCYVDLAATWGDVSAMARRIAELASGGYPALSPECAECLACLGPCGAPGSERAARGGLPLSEGIPVPVEWLLRLLQELPASPCAQAVLAAVTHPLLEAASRADPPCLPMCAASLALLSHPARRSHVAVAAASAFCAAVPSRRAALLATAMESITGSQGGRASPNQSESALHCYRGARGGGAAGSSAADGPGQTSRWQRLPTAVPLHRPPPLSLFVRSGVLSGPPRLSLVSYVACLPRHASATLNVPGPGLLLTHATFRKGSADDAVMSAGAAVGSVGGQVMGGVTPWKCSGSRGGPESASIISAPGTSPAGQEPQSTQAAAAAAAAMATESATASSVADLMLVVTTVLRSAQTTVAEPLSCDMFGRRIFSPSSPGHYGGVRGGGGGAYASMISGASSASGLSLARLCGEPLEVAALGGALVYALGGVGGGAAALAGVLLTQAIPQALEAAGAQAPRAPPPSSQGPTPPPPAGANRAPPQHDGILVGYALAQLATATSLLAFLHPVRDGPAVSSASPRASRGGGGTAPPTALFSAQQAASLSARAPQDHADERDKGHHPPHGATEDPPGVPGSLGQKRPRPRPDLDAGLAGLAAGQVWDERGGTLVVPGQGGAAGWAGDGGGEKRGRRSVKFQKGAGVLHASVLSEHLEYVTSLLAAPGSGVNSSHGGTGSRAILANGGSAGGPGEWAARGAGPGQGAGLAPGSGSGGPWEPYALALLTMLVSHVPRSLCPVPVAQQWLLAFRLQARGLPTLALAMFDLGGVEGCAAAARFVCTVAEDDKAGATGVD